MYRVGEVRDGVASDEAQSVKNKEAKFIQVRNRRIIGVQKILYVCKYIYIYISY